MARSMNDEHLIISIIWRHSKMPASSQWLILIWWKWELMWWLCLWEVRLCCRVGYE